MKKTKTPKTRITSAIRKLWLSSRERAAALKRDNYTCQECGAKQSKAKGKEIKVCVHHKMPIDWSDVEHYIRAEVLRDPEALETMCVKCHKAHHSKDKK